jgi:hypothetical protein
MTFADAFSKTGEIPSSTANVQLSMYNGYLDNHPDNNLLSAAILAPPDTIFFNWVNFHQANCSAICYRLAAR